MRIRKIEDFMNHPGISREQQSKFYDAFLCVKQMRAVTQSLGLEWLVTPQWVEVRVCIKVYDKWYQYGIGRRNKVETVTLIGPDGNENTNASIT
ncbi:hypothetical protein JKP88DRAFT_274162 [Tribonema minus]|uniref:Uncharacterized protein n=1 Tax=Tribonema minus TaxID=303371 RepID=A0A835YVR2_9STRA|nr:hypothetical protein JKP88DRAFT_274162 [Tribonema minus]